MRLFAAVILAAIVSSPALAGQSEAQSCAAGLDANGQLIFNAALPQISPSADLRGVLTTATKSLVESGQVARRNARPAAMAAAECLKLAMQ